MALKAAVQTPGVPNEEPEIEEIDLPPQELWSELNNAAGGQTVVAAASGQAPSLPVEKPEVAELQFVSDRTKVVPLKFPFIWNGAEINEVRIGRLTLAQANEILMRSPDVKMTTFDIYARMTGLPAAVLRGLDSEDGTAVTEAAYDFLPRSLRTDGG